VHQSLRLPRSIIPAQLIIEGAVTIFGLSAGAAARLQRRSGRGTDSRLSASQRDRRSVAFWRVAAKELARAGRAHECGGRLAALEACWKLPRCVLQPLVRLPASERIRARRHAGGRRQRARRAAHARRQRRRARHPRRRLVARVPRGVKQVTDGCRKQAFSAICRGLASGFQSPVEDLWRPVLALACDVCGHASWCQDGRGGQVRRPKLGRGDIGSLDAVRRAWVAAGGRYAPPVAREGRVASRGRARGLRGREWAEHVAHGTRTHGRERGGRRGENERVNRAPGGEDRKGERGDESHKPLALTGWRARIRM
jgi:hypothetical protein